MDEDIVTQLIMEAERLRQEITFQQQHFEREIMNIQKNHLKQIKDEQEHFQREYMAQQEHIQKHFEDEEKRFNIEQTQFLKENEELRQKLNSGDGNFREKYEIENEITNVLDRRIKILEKELEKARHE